MAVKQSYPQYGRIREELGYGMRLSKRRQWFGEGENDAQEGDATGEGSDANQNGGDNNVTFTSEQQAHIDKLIAQKIAKEREKADKAAQEASEKAKQEAEAAQKKKAEEAERKRLAEEGKFKELNDSLTAERDKLTVDLETAQTSVQTATEQLEAYKSVVSDLIQERRKAVPEHFHALLDGLEPLEQLKWFTENADKLNSGNERGNGTPGQRRNGAKRTGDQSPPPRRTSSWRL